MRKLLYIMLIATLVTGLMFMGGCGDKDKEKDPEDHDIESMAKAEYDAALDTFSNARGFADLSDYLKKWAKKNKIKVEKDDSAYLVLSLPAAEGYEKAPSATLQMPVGSGNSSVNCEVLSVLLTTIMTSEAHGNVKVIFTDAGDSGFTGAKKLDEKYLETDNFINLVYADVLALYNRGGASSVNKVTQKPSRKTSDNEKAFRISITGLSGGMSGSPESAEKPNPIEVITGFLAAAKSDGFVFDLAGFTGGVSAYTLPKNASAVIVVPASSVERLKGRFETSHKRFLKNYEKIEPDASYDLMETEKPGYVLSNDSKDDVLNMLYMFDAETRLNENGDTTHSSNLGWISLSSGKFTVGISLESVSKEDLDDSLLSLKTSCGLCNMKCRTVSTSEPWITYEESYLVSTLADLCSAEPKSTIVQNENTIFKDRNKKLASVSFGVNLSSCKRSVKALDKFLTGLINADEDMKEMEED